MDQVNRNFYEKVCLQRVRTRGVVDQSHDWFRSDQSLLTIRISAVTGNSVR